MSASGQRRCAAIWRSLYLGCIVAGLAISPILAGPPFRTDDPVPVEFQHFEINMFSLGTKTVDGFNGILPGAEVNYGVLPNLQLHAMVPLGFTSPVGGRTGFALGDIELGAKYRFITPGDDDWFPQVAVFPLVEVPAGNQKLGFSTGHTQVFLPIWLQKDFGPWTVYGGGGYWINPGLGNRNYGFAGAAVWRKITDEFQVGVEAFHQTSPADGVKDSTGFNVGAIYDISETWHLLGSVGTGLQNRSTTNQLSYYVALQSTF
jgi:hypothetical protein